MGFFSSSKKKSHHHHHRHHSRHHSAPQAGSPSPYVGYIVPVEPKRQSCWKRWLQVDGDDDDDEVAADGPLYPEDDVEVEYDEEGRPYRLMRDSSGRLVFYYYPIPLPLSYQPLPTSPICSSPLPHRPILATPPEVQTNPWSIITHDSTVLDELQMCQLSEPVRFHPLLSYVPNGKAPMVFDIRLSTSIIYTYRVPENSVSFDEPATAPKVSCLKLVFPYSSVVLPIVNPKGVTIGQVLFTISQHAKANLSKEDFDGMDESTRASVVGAYWKNGSHHQENAEPEMKVYDSFLDLVYFAGLVRDEDAAEKRVGWRDPTVFVAQMVDANSMAASGYASLR